MDRLRQNGLSVLVHVGALAPLIWMIWPYASGRHPIDPISKMTAIAGQAGLILLILSLSCTPIRIIFGFTRILRERRTLGMYAFGYVLLHVLVFVGWDYGFDLSLVWRDLPYQRYVIPGLLTLMLLFPLAVTSTVGWRRRLGPSWQRLHYLVYLAAILDVVHLYWSRKEPGDALRYAVAVGALLAMRVPPVTAALHWLREKLTAHPYAGKNRRR